MLELQAITPHAPPAPTRREGRRGRANAGETSERPLDFSEQFLWRFDRAASMNGVFVVHIKGALFANSLRVGIDAIQARNPQLRWRIQEENGGAVFRADGVGAIPLRVVDATDGDWQRETEVELNTLFDTARGPLARAVLVRHSAEDHHLVWTVHHCFTGGRPIFHLLRDLVEATAQAQRGIRPSRRSFVDVQPLAERRPQKHRGPKRYWRALRFMLREIGLAFRHGSPVKMQRDGEAPAHERQCRLIHRTFDAAFTAHLVARARAEGASVTSALTAALILSIVEDAEVSSTSRVTIGNAVDLAPELEPPIEPGAIGCCAISSVQFKGAVDPKTPLWELARTVRRQLTEDVAAGDAYTMLDLFRLVFDAVGGGRVPPAVLSDRFERLAMITTGLSNIGVQAIDRRFGALSIESLHLMAPPSAFLEFFAVANTFHDRLFINFLWTSPLLNEAHANRLVTRIVARLKAAVGEA